jgi:hypothetical protein
MIIRNLKLENVEIAKDNVEERDILPEGVTHIIATPAARTMKVLQSIVCSKWIMAPEWILQLQQLPDVTNMSQEEIFDLLIRTQSDYGFKCNDNFLKNRSVYLAESFQILYKQTPTWRHCKSLIEFAGATFVKNINQADFCLIGTIPQQNNNNNTSSSSSSSSSSSTISPSLQIASLNAPDTCHICDWGSFIDLIYPPYHETALLKCRGLYEEMETQTPLTPPSPPHNGNNKYYKQYQKEQSDHEDEDEDSFVPEEEF